MHQSQRTMALLVTGTVLLAALDLRAFDSAKPFKLLQLLLAAI